MSLNADRDNISSNNFFSEAIQIIEERFGDKSARVVSECIQNWRKLLIATDRSFVNFKEQIKDEEKIGELELTYGIVQLHALDASRIIEGASLCAVAGYSGSSLVLLRIAIERILYGLYFTVEPPIFDDGKGGKIRLTVTGKNGITGRLNNSTRYFNFFLLFF